MKNILAKPHDDCDIEGYICVKQLLQLTWYLDSQFIKFSAAKASHLIFNSHSLCNTRM